MSEGFETPSEGTAQEPRDAGHRVGRRLAAESTVSVCSVLDLDPDLADNVQEAERPLARRACCGRLISLATGSWEMEARADLLGFLIVDGIVCREFSLVDRRSLELLGAGDVVSPITELAWPQPGGGGVLTAITDALAIELGPSFMRAAARWPSVLAAVFRRLEAQRARLAIQGLIVHVPRADHRLLLALWHLAARWGRVTPVGIVLPLHLTHGVLGQLIGARRSTVTLAVGRGEADGWLVRRDDGTWLLTRQAEQLAASLSLTRSARSDGESLMLRQRSAEVVRGAQAARASARQSRNAHSGS